MATADTLPRSHDRTQRRKPFSSLMKRLANLKNSDSNTTNNTKQKKNAIKNNPYPESGRAGRTEQNGLNTPSLSVPISHASQPSLSTQLNALSTSSVMDPREEHMPNGGKSAAPTVSTKAETTHSDAGQSKAGTVTTAGGAVSSNGAGGEGSTFSSPAPSVKSLTTTLTTIQSAAPANAVAAPAGQTVATGSGAQSSQFSHQFPSSPPPSAIPSHLTASHVGGHPTYNLATANNLLTDNASILTLASSSKRRRRNSLDTNASVRALAPSSIFGGSRESLPLSVLSGNIGESRSLSGVHDRTAIGGTPAVERASVYSSSGVAPALTSERNSYYASKQANAGDGSSIRSGLAHHGRNDSITGSIGGQASPLASPRETISSIRTGQPGQGLGETEEEAERNSK